MEIAIYIGNETKLNSCQLDMVLPPSTNQYEKHLNQYLSEAIEELKKRCLDTFSRIYYGSEFCDKCIPTEKELDKIIDLCQRLNVSFSFVTPPLCDTEFNTCLERIHYVKRRIPHFEVIVNDIGLAYELSSDEDITIVFGRLFDKTSHDGRVDRDQISAYFGTEGLCYAGQSAVYSKQMLTILKEMNVKSLEIDLPTQAVTLGDYPTHVLIPFAYMTTGRKCMFGEIEKSIFSTDGQKCSRVCRKYQQLMKKPLNQVIKEKELILFRKGNTIYYGEKNYTEILDQVERIVIEVQL